MQRRKIRKWERGRNVENKVTKEKEEKERRKLKGEYARNQKR